MARDIDGVPLLTPVVSIPERELIVWENPALAERIRTGITEAHAGPTVDLGDFTGCSSDTAEGWLPAPIGFVLPPRPGTCWTCWTAVASTRPNCVRCAERWDCCK